MAFAEDQHEAPSTPGGFQPFPKDMTDTDKAGLLNDPTHDAVTVTDPPERPQLTAEEARDMAFFLDFIALDTAGVPSFTGGTRRDTDRGLEWFDISIDRVNPTNRSLRFTEHYYLNITPGMLAIGRSINPGAIESDTRGPVQLGDMVYVRGDGGVHYRRNGQEIDARRLPVEDFAAFLSRDLIGSVSHLYLGKDRAIEERTQEGYALVRSMEARYNPPRPVEQPVVPPRY